ncbi:MAG: glycosyltransferase family 4 protein [Methanobacterium sp.]|jgi:glycosyltransferase involved in cell wall biosynthesis|nr:glycosyltransferase family 4 protein [Methanobacterium sp.]
MKIAMIISTPFPPEEGIGFYTYNLSRKLIEKGHEVTVITRGKLGPEFSFFEGIQIIKVPFIPLYPFHVKIHGFLMNRFFRSIENDFDLVHLHTPLVPVLKTSLPMISTIHGSLLGNAQAIELVDLKSAGNRIMTRYVSFPLIKKLIMRSDRVTTVSKPVSCELKEHYGLDKVEIIPNGVDEKQFTPSEPKDEYLLYVGRLTYGKGLKDLLKAVKNVCRMCPLKLLLVGEGELENHLKRFIKSEGLEDDVQVTGKKSHQELVEIYQNALLFIFPSHYEGFPTVVLEAMSSGLPVLVSDIPAHAAFIKDFDNGVLVKKGSVEDLSQKIILLYENRDLRKQLGNRARETVMENFTWDKNSREFEELYKQVLTIED